MMHEHSDTLIVALRETVHKTLDFVPMDCTQSKAIFETFMQQVDTLPVTEKMLLLGAVAGAGYGIAVIMAPGLPQ